MGASSNDERPENPRAKANVFEVITFSWIVKLVRKGLKKELSITDLYPILNEDSCATLSDKLEKFWQNEVKNTIEKKLRPSFLKTLLRMFGLRITMCGIFLGTFDLVFSIIQTICVGKIIKNFESKESAEHFQSIMYYASFLITASTLKTFCQSIYSTTISHLAMKIRVATCGVIYNKALRLSANTMNQNTVGRVVNLMSNDVTRFDLAMVYLSYVFVGPVETVVITYILWRELGAASLLGMGTFLFFVPFQVWLGSMASDFRRKTADRTDVRVSLMNQIISGIQVIKMYTWENFFTKLVELARKKEMSKITKAAYIKTTLLSFSIFNARLALFLSILLYVFLGNQLTAPKVFLVTSYFNVLRVTMTLVFPPGIGMVAELLVSINRIEDFLLSEEKDLRSIKTTREHDKPHSTITETNGTRYTKDYKHSNSPSIVLTNATAKWTDSPTDYSMENINLTVKSGQLVVVIGPVGAGKSSLLQAILCELPLSAGNVSVHGVVSYASQSPWLFAGSVRENILFGLPMDEERYRHVTEICALGKDLKRFPYGDRTIVGERGVSLSGGQKARINLARAMYKKADIYLLDDPLSAVDANVSKHLFEKCIEEFLKKKTCVLVTHQLQHLTSIEQVVLMENSKIVAHDSFRHLQKNGYNFTKTLGFSDGTGGASEIDSETGTKHIESDSLDDQLASGRRVSVSSVTSTVDKNNSVDSNGPVERAESRSFGNTGLKMYLSYFSAGGHRCKVLLFFLLCIFTQILISSGDYWMTHWINLEEHVFFSVAPFTTNNNSTQTTKSRVPFPWITSRKTCIIVLTLLILSSIIFALVRSTLYVSVCTTSSSNLHSRMLDSTMRATMQFFNTNASGRILNRFSNDMGITDELLSFSLLDVIQTTLVVIGVLVVIGITNPYLIVPTLVLLVYFFKLRSIYSTISRQVKRLEGVARSPVLTHLNASLQGLTTVRAFGAEKLLAAEFAKHQDLHSSAWYLFISLARAFGIWLDIACLVFISIVTFSFLIFRHELYGGNVGLAITQSIGLMGFFQWGMRKSVDLENYMTSVERILEYTRLPREPALESPQEKKPPAEWPDKGRITFSDFHLRYDANEPYVLKNLNIDIEPTEKIGIVGRTGAGKSSLVGALFRLAQNEGHIFIDDREIHEMGLLELRSKLTFIPQEPILFSGTIRNNLDLYDEYSDHQIWSVLNEVELKAVVEDLPNGLNSKMSDGGSNFSVGQRQLVCLARAILQDNKILVLDEVTANVDHRTDALIQNTIKNKFRTCTVLTIAHRLNTVMDSDKILVMDSGAVAEFDHPHNLLQNLDGYLHKMVEQTGPVTARLLHRMAAENFKNSRSKIPQKKHE